MQCQSCGRWLPPGAAVCPACRLHVPLQATPPTPDFSFSEYTSYGKNIPYVPYLPNVGPSFTPASQQLLPGSPSQPQGGQQPPYYVSRQQFPQHPPNVQGQREKQHMSYQPPTNYHPNPEWRGQGGYAQPGYSQPPPYGNDQQYAPLPQPGYGYTPAGPYPGYGVPMAPPGTGSELAILGLALGLVSLVASITFYFWFCGLPLSLVGIFVSALGRRSISRRATATTGLVLSIIALVLSGLIVVLGILTPGIFYGF